MDKQLYRVGEVAAILGIGKSHVYALANDGYLAKHNRNPGKKGLRIPHTSIIEYIEKYQATSPQM